MKCTSYYLSSLTTIPSVIKRTIPPRIWIIKKDTGSPRRLSFWQQLKILPWPVIERNVKNDRLSHAKWHLLWFFSPHLNWLKITQRQICIIHLKIGVLYKNKNKSLYLQLHVPSAPRQGPQPLARSPLLVHLCPEDEECRWGSMGWAVPGTLGTVLQWARAAEGAQIIFSLFTFAILNN